MACQLWSFHHSMKKNWMKMKTFGTAMHRMSLANWHVSRDVWESSTLWQEKQLSWMSVRKTRSLLLKENMETSTTAMLTRMFGAKVTHKMTASMGSCLWKKRSLRMAFCIIETSSLDFHRPFGFTSLQTHFASKFHGRITSSYFLIRHFTATAALKTIKLLLAF